MGRFRFSKVWSVVLIVIFYNGVLKACEGRYVESLLSFLVGFFVVMGICVR